jgi:hypothetical protein
MKAKLLPPTYDKNSVSSAGRIYSIKNMFIDGEKLEVLKILQKSCFGKIKVILL